MIIQARLFAAQLKKETERLAHLITDLLDLTRLESQEPTNYPTLVDVRSVLDDRARPYERVAKERYHPPVETLRQGSPIHRLRRRDSTDFYVH